MKWMKLLRNIGVGLAELLIVALCVALVWRAKLSREVEATNTARTADLEVLRTKAYPREVHAPPVLPGTFGELAQAAFDRQQHHRQCRCIDRMAAESCGDDRDWHDIHRLSSDVARRLAPLPPSCPAFTAAEWPFVSQLLRATHASVGATPKTLLPHRAEWEIRQTDRLVQIPWVAVIRMRELMDADKPDDALAICADLLALGREFANGSALEGRSIETTTMEIAAEPCATAIRLASSTARARFRRAVDRIRRSIPPLSDALRQEAIATWIQYSGPAWVPEGSNSLERAATYLLRPFLFQAARDESHLAMELAPSADLESTQRRQGFLLVQAKAARAWNDIARSDWERWERSAERDDNARTTLQKLRTLAEDPPMGE